MAQLLHHRRPAFSRPGSPATVSLPGSKSESARLLVMQSLQPELTVNNHSSARDTALLTRLIDEAKAGKTTWDVADAGTAMRFGLAYLATQGFSGVLRGSDRMHQRPIGILVDALRQLGARITYLEEEGYPPLRLDGFSFSGKQSLTLDPSVSSQYVTALMLVAPYLPLGLEIHFAAEPVSAPYLGLTMQLMRQAGATVVSRPTNIAILPGGYQPGTMAVGADWSAASYPLAAALLTGQSVWLPGLQQHTAQGDIRIAHLLQLWGLQLSWRPDGLLATGGTAVIPSDPVDFTDCPDLAQTVITLACALNQPLHATGLETLYIKETDRVAALVTELSELGAHLRSPRRGEIVVEGGNITGPPVAIYTYGDHRMAMALAPLAALRPLIIDEPAVVRKSFPDFWTQMQSLGYLLVEE